jgi:hypothetical protein
LTHSFLSTQWFTEVARIREEIGDLGLPPRVRELVVNLEVSDGPDGTVQAHVVGGALARGLASRATATLRLPFRIAHRLFVQRDRSAGLQAFLAGQIQVEGDFGALLELHSSGETAETRELLERISAITS